MFERMILERAQLMRSLIGALAAIVLVASGAAVAKVETNAWPRIIMFYDGPMKDARAHLTKQTEVIDFMDAIQKFTWNDIPVNTPFVSVGLYWNENHWESYLTDRTRLMTLPVPRAFGAWREPSSRDDLIGNIQPARLYLGDRSRPPVFEIGSAGSERGYRRISDAGLAILKRLNVPTSVN